MKSRVLSKNRESKKYTEGRNIMDKIESLNETIEIGTVTPANPESSGINFEHTYPKMKFQFLFFTSIATLLFFLLKVVVECVVNFVKSFFKTFVFLILFLTIVGLICGGLFVINQIAIDGFGPVLYEVGLVVLCISFVVGILVKFGSFIFGIVSVILGAVSSLLDAICVSCDKKYRYFLGKLKEKIERI